MEKFSEYKLGAYMSCPRKYYYQYVKRIQKPKKSIHPNFILGKNVHEACKEFYKLPTEGRTLSALQNSFRKIWKTGASHKFFSSKEEEAKLGRNGLSMLENFHARYATKKPYLIEKYIERSYKGYTLFGRTDRVDMNEEGTLSVIDYKTNKLYELEGKAREKQTLQLRIYALLLNNKSRPVRKGAYYHMMEDEFDELEFSDENIGYIKEYIDELIDDITHDKLFEPNFGKPCSWCDYKEECSQLHKQGISTTADDNAGQLGLQ